MAWGLRKEARRINFTDLYYDVQVCPCLGPATDCRPGCCVSTGLRRECTVYSEHSTQYSTVQGQWAAGAVSLSPAAVRVTPWQRPSRQPSLLTPTPDPGPPIWRLRAETRARTQPASDNWDQLSLAPRPVTRCPHSSFHHRDKVLKCQDWL